MSRERAPMARRTPISRVRSVTETSMMFMMPMPPTTSETAATPARSVVSMPVTDWSTAWMSRGSRTAKLSSSPGSDVPPAAQDAR